MFLCHPGSRQCGLSASLSLPLVCPPPVPVILDPSCSLTQAAFLVKSHPRPSGVDQHGSGAAASGEGPARPPGQSAHLGRGPLGPQVLGRS